MIIPAVARWAAAGATLIGLASGATAAPATSRPVAVTARPASPVANDAATLTPEAAVRAFLQYRDTNQDARAYSLLSDDYRKRKTLAEWLDQARNVRTAYMAVITVAGESLLIGGNKAVSSHIGKSSPEGKFTKVPVTQLVSIPTPIYLVREHGQWHIDMDKTTNPDEPSTPTNTRPNLPPPPPTTPQTPVRPTPPTPPDTAPQCRANAREIMTAFQVYALDHDGRLPDASKWVDSITSYLSTPTVLKCPADTSTHRTSFAMNSAMSGQRLVDIHDPTKTEVLFETDSADSNPSGTPHPLAKPRHPSGDVVVLADGTVDQISSGK